MTLDGTFPNEVRMLPLLKVSVLVLVVVDDTEHVQKISVRGQGQNHCRGLPHNRAKHRAIHHTMMIYNCAIGSTQF